MALPVLLPTAALQETFAGVTYHIEGELVPVLHLELNAVPIYFEHHILLCVVEGSCRTHRPEIVQGRIQADVRMRMYSTFWENSCTRSASENPSSFRKQSFMSIQRWYISHRKPVGGPGYPRSRSASRDLHFVLLVRKSL